MDQDQTNKPSSDADLRKNREDKRRGNRQVSQNKKGLFGKLGELLGLGNNVDKTKEKVTKTDQKKGKQAQIGTVANVTSGVINETSPQAIGVPIKDAVNAGVDNNAQESQQTSWQDDQATVTPDTASNSKKNGRQVVFAIFVAVLVAIALVGWQLYTHYLSTQHIDSSAKVERGTNVPDARISGQKVSQQYAEKVNQAEEERKGDSSSFVEQSVDILGEKNQCVNCEARIADLEVTAKTLVENDQTLDRNINQVYGAVQTQGKTLEDMRQQIANLARPTTQQQTTPIPEAYYYKDYKGHEYMNPQRRQLEIQHLEGIMAVISTQSKGENIEGFASYTSIPSATSRADGQQHISSGQINGPELIATGYYSAQLEIGVNTDKGVSPIVATITSGPHRGTRLISRGYSAEREGVQIVFTEFVSERGQRGSITAYAIDADTKVSGVASDVNKHYGTRILGTVLTRAIQGWGDAYANQGTTVISDGVTSQTRNTSSGDAIRQGIGAGAGAVGDIIDEISNRPPTIRVDAQSYEIGVFVVDPGIAGNAARNGTSL